MGSFSSSGTRAAQAQAPLQNRAHRGRWPEGGSERRCCGLALFGLALGFALPMHAQTLEGRQGANDVNGVVVINPAAPPERDVDGLLNSPGR
jgi:hypothetical protein